MIKTRVNFPSMQIVNNRTYFITLFILDTANSEDRDEMPHNTDEILHNSAFHQGLHCKAKNQYISENQSKGVITDNEMSQATSKGSTLNQSCQSSRYYGRRL